MVGTGGEVAQKKVAVQPSSDSIKSIPSFGLPRGDRAVLQLEHPA